MKYFGRWDDPAGAEAEYLDWLAKKGKIEKVESQVKKPYPDFPLTPHKGSGKWCVKIKSHFHYFGRLDDPQGALDEFKAVEDDLRAGRTPRTVQGLTVKQVINSWLGVKAARVASGELKPRSLADYTRISTAMAESLGSTRPFASLGPADFEKLRKDFAKTHGPVRLSGDITVARMIVRHAQRFHLIVVEPGPTFIKPSALTLRRERGKKPPRYFKPKEFRKLLKAAKEPLRTMLLLALNCGFSNADCAELKVEDVNPRSPLLKIPRTKTAMPRTCYLWPETRKALQEVIAAQAQGVQGGRRRAGIHHQVRQSLPADPGAGLPDRQGNSQTAQSHRTLSGQPELRGTAAYLLERGRRHLLQERRGPLHGPSLGTPPPRDRIDPGQRPLSGRYVGQLPRDPAERGAEGTLEATGPRRPQLCLQPSR